MALSNSDRVGRSLELLRAGLTPFVERECESSLGQSWPSTLVQRMPENVAHRATQSGTFDVAMVLNIMWHNWNDIFSSVLGRAERTLVSELRDIRNRWAHQEAFSTDDAYRALDSMERLLRAVSAPETSEVEAQKQAVLRQRFSEMARTQIRRSASSSVEGAPTAGLLPWREIVTPHPDVASGKFQQAEFAADLDKVYREQALPEYGDPKAFFARTYLTEGLKTLLVTALRRISKNGGDPVVELQTNFGGGKTHSMLALYHLFSGVPASELLGADEVMSAAEVKALPKVRKAVLVGTALSPAQVHRKDDGTHVHTLWGEMAYQLLGSDGYSYVADADRQGVSPGSTQLVDLFRAASPCLILIDEWVTFARQLYHNQNLPAGSFDANMSFAQSLTEAAKAAPGCIVVASIPASDIEYGGEGGREAATRLRNVFARVESGWRPASSEESFEIVRRRLFQPMEADKYPLRDAVVKKFVELYLNQAAEFPSECRESAYERRLVSAYPIHPELFDRLYNDWCSLEKFQRTRGVLRLMAAAIHALWRDGDKGLLIMPSNMPVSETTITSELTRYLDDPWLPVIEKDVDGENSLPKQLDGGNPNLGRYSACRRVARTLFMGSAPTLHAANKGLDEKQVKLGCVQPGESVATFGDALRRLTDNATHLYVDGQRLWFSTQPSVNRLAQDRAEQQKIEDVHAEIVSWLRKFTGERGLFAGVHPAPTSSGEVPDERDTRLVVLGPSSPHSARSSSSPARLECAKMLDSKGNNHRRFKNSLVFLVPDATRLGELENAVRSYLAWKSIVAETNELQLTPFAQRQAETKRKSSEDAIKARIPETFVWLLVPSLDSPLPGTAIEWEEYRLQGPDPLAVRAGVKLQAAGGLTSQLAGTILRKQIELIPLWRSGFAFDGRKDQILVRQLMDDFATYLYLPRLSSPSILLSSIAQGVSSLAWEIETFAYADGIDASAKRYLGLRAAEACTPLDAGVIVHPLAAREQMDADVAAAALVTPPTPDGGFKGSESTTGADAGGTSEVDTNENQAGAGKTTQATERLQATRFFGSVDVNPMKASREMDELSQAVIQHLVGLVGSNVRITVDIQAEFPNGVPDDVQRIVLENCNVLKFSQKDFDSD